MYGSTLIIYYRLADARVDYFQYHRRAINIDNNPQELWFLFFYLNLRGIHLNLRGILIHHIWIHVNH